MQEPYKEMYLHLYKHVNDNEDIKKQFAKLLDGL